MLERGPEGVGCLRDVMAVFPLLGSLWGLWALNGTSEMALSSHSGKRQGKALIWFCSSSVYGTCAMAMAVSALANSRARPQAGPVPSLP